EEFCAAVETRVGARALLEQNTIINPKGPQPGDLMAKVDHTSLIYKVYPPGVPHPLAANPRIPVFPGAAQAAKEINQTEYLREVKTSATPGIYFDYLNHRGMGKQRAELIYYASSTEMRNDGFEYRMYKPGVIDNWRDWSGEGSP